MYQLRTMITYIDKAFSTIPQQSSTSNIVSKRKKENYKHIPNIPGIQQVYESVFSFISFDPFGFAEPQLFLPGPLHYKGCRISTTAAEVSLPSLEPLVAVVSPK